MLAVRAGERLAAPAHGARGGPPAAGVLQRVLQGELLCVEGVGSGGAGWGDGDVGGGYARDAAGAGAGVFEDACAGLDRWLSDGQVGYRVGGDTFWALVRVGHCVGHGGRSVSVL